MRIQEKKDLEKIQSMLASLSKNELNAILTIIESMAQKQKKKKYDDFEKFLANAPEVEATEWEKKAIKRAKRSKKTYDFDEVLKKYDL